MNKEIRINLFGNFEILKNGEQILESLSNTRKTKLFLAYLMINKDRLVTHRELFELLWAGQEYSNPGTALRTLLYRYRNLVTDSGYQELENSIISKRGAYIWNRELDISIDIYDFEDFSAVGLNNVLDRQRRMDCLKSAIELYKGSLLLDSSDEHWVVPKSAKYRDMYVQDVREYVFLLKEEGKKAEAKEVIEKAIDICGHNDIFDMEQKLLSDKHDDNDEKIYSIITNQMDSMSDDLDYLQKNMESDDSGQSAFICDYETFKEIYHLQRRLLARTGETMYVSLLSLGFSNESLDPLREERVMKALLDSTKVSLRCGDSICRYSDSCLAVMFPAGAYDDAKGVVERIRKVFLTSTKDSDIVISYKLRPLKNIKD